MIEGIPLYWHIACFSNKLLQGADSDAGLGFCTGSMDDFLLANSAIQVICTKA